MQKLKKTLRFVKVSSVALTMASAAALAVTPMSWDAAYAKGGNGNGNGNGGGNGNGNGKGGGQTARGNNGGGKPAHVTTRKSSTATASVETEVEVIEEELEVTEGEEIEEPRNHGALASELKGLNAAHANPNALANASPNSMPGKLATYRDTINEVAEAEENVTAAGDSLTAAEEELARLNGLTDDEIAAEFPDGGFDDAVVDAEAGVITAEEDVIAAEEDLETAGDSEGALDTLTGGRTLSDAALAELHRLLDIES